MINKVDKVYHSFYIGKELLKEAKDVAWSQRKPFNQFVIDAIRSAVNQATEKEVA